LEKDWFFSLQHRLEMAIELITALAIGPIISKYKVDFYCWEFPTFVPDPIQHLIFQIRGLQKSQVKFLETFTLMKLRRESPVFS
jgi:hypothetical protein